MGEFDRREFRDACGQFSTGVTVITTSCDDGDHGMTANAFMSISLDPPLIAISVAEGAKMRAKIQKTGRFAVSILAHGTERTAWHFAGKRDETLRDLLKTEGGMPVVRGSAAFFIAEVTDAVAAGDHILFIGKVNALSFDPAAKPLLFHRGRFSALMEEIAAAIH